MGRSKTQDLPDLSALLVPRDELMLAVEQAVLRNRTSALGAASRAEQIAAKLAGVITLGFVEPGQRLLESDISEVLQVSRAPVREALRILERDRLVQFQSQRGALVTDLRASDVRDLFDVRAALYVMVLRQELAEQPEDLAAVFDANIGKVLQAARESVDAYAVATFLLNGTVAQISRNHIVGELLQSVSLQTLRYVRVGLAATPRELPSFARKWRALHRAVVERDVDRAVELAVQRIDSVRDAALRVLGAAPARPAGRRAV